MEQDSYECAPQVRLVEVHKVPSVVRDAPLVSNSANAAEAAKLLIGGKDREHFLVQHLDGRHRMVSYELASIGTLTSSLVHPREIFKGALLANAAAILCVHNHPSGNLEPSAEDREVFSRIKSSGELLGIPLLAFLIVSESEHWSAKRHWPK